MFGWSRAKCPCDPAAKAWIELRLKWLYEEFPESAFSMGPVILPTSKYFPDPFDGSDRAVLALLHRVCGYMEVDPELIDVDFVSKAGNLWLVNESGKYLPPGAAGTYQEMEYTFHITIDRSEFGDPMNLVGTFAHELSHVRLMGERHVAGDEFDNEILTDLMTVHVGMGLFLANSPRAWDSTFSTWQGTNLAKPEYMTTPMFAYALAHLAWFREERHPPWSKFLRWDSRPDFKRGLRYLWQTRGSTFRP